jgi:hypothetical protein
MVDDELLHFRTNHAAWTTRICAEAPSSALLNPSSIDTENILDPNLLQQ